MGYWFYLDHLVDIYLSSFQNSELIRLHYILLPEKLLQPWRSKILTSALFSLMDRRPSISHVWSFATLIALTARRHDTTTLRDSCRRWWWGCQNLYIREAYLLAAINASHVRQSPIAKDAQALSFQLVPSSRFSDEFPVAGGHWKSIS